MARKFGAKKYTPYRASNPAALKYNSTYRCDGCGMHYKKKPAQCRAVGCTSMVFTFFHSTAEANEWAKLLLFQERGVITNLRRQVSYKLHTVNADGHKVVVGRLIPDFEYNDREGTLVTQDTKGGETDLSKWKHRHFKAEYGRTILLTK